MNYLCNNLKWAKEIIGKPEQHVKNDNYGKSLKLWLKQPNTYEGFISNMGFICFKKQVECNHIFAKI